MTTAFIARLFVRLFLAAAIMGTLFVTAASADVSKTLKDRLFARYDHQNLNVVHEKILVTALNGSGGNPFDYAINYDFFHPAIAKSGWPKKYQQRNLLDEQTTEEVESRARFTDALQPGEMVRVLKFYVKAESGFHVIDMYLVALDGKRAGAAQPADFGCHFRFVIPPIAPGFSEDAYFDEIARVIGLYMMPTEEYLAQNKAAAAAVEARKNVTIQPGMSKAEVVQILGEPLKTVTFGERTFLKYADLTIELQSGKVVDVKPN